MSPPVVGTERLAARCFFLSARTGSPPHQVDQRRSTHRLQPLTAAATALRPVSQGSNVPTTRRGCYLPPVHGVCAPAPRRHHDRLHPDHSRSTSAQASGRLRNQPAMGLRMSRPRLRPFRTDRRPHHAADHGPPIPDHRPDHAGQRPAHAMRNGCATGRPLRIGRSPPARQQLRGLRISPHLHAPGYGWPGQSAQWAQPRLRSRRGTGCAGLARRLRSREALAEAPDDDVPPGLGTPLQAGEGPDRVTGQRGNGMDSCRGDEVCDGSCESSPYFRTVFALLCRRQNSGRTGLDDHYSPVS